MLLTSRLRLRRFTTADAAFVLELLNTADWLTYIGKRGVTDMDEAAAYIRRAILPAYKHPGLGAWLVTRRSDGAAVGMCGLYERPGLPRPDLGFALLPTYYRQGYAYEAARAVLTYGDRHGICRPLAICLPTNTASVALLRKLDFAVTRHATLDGGAEELLVWTYRPAADGREE